MSTCDTGNEYDGRLGLRISSIFVIFVGSYLGAWFPVYAVRHQNAGIPDWVFFFAKYFGSGVIVATAFVHLLAPASEALRHPCLTGPITEYSWVEGICLIAIFVLFFVELMTMRFAKFGHSHDNTADYEPVYSSDDSPPAINKSPNSSTPALDGARGITYHTTQSSCPSGPFTPGDDHLSHSRDHPSSPTRREKPRSFLPDSYAAQMTAITILEFGVIFHSIFIGLTLSVAGTEFVTLYVVLVFHQTFEGLALGTRLASIDWPSSKRATPYYLSAAYAISTPLAIAVGIAVRESLAPGGQTMLIVNGISDSISAGILIYTGLVELMAHEFMFSGHMQRAPIREVLAAFGFMGLGAFLMALLGKWA